MTTTSRPTTPDSPSSLRKATATIDDLTAALSNFSRVPSPEPLNAALCCCGWEDCESSKAWSALKSKLENRLILSAGECSMGPSSYIPRLDLVPLYRSRSSTFGKT